jgi:hypothetical protein
MKTSNLTGIALNWAVEKAKGTFWSNGYFHYPKNHPIFTYPYTKETVSYCTEWEHGGPIIDREKINTAYSEFNFYENIEWAWRAYQGDWGKEPMYGPTLLIAAMRCYVASKLGNEVNIPIELNF